MNESQQENVFHIAATYGERKTASTLGVKLDVTRNFIVSWHTGNCEIMEEVSAHRSQSAQEGQA